MEIELEKKFRSSEYGFETTYDENEIDRLIKNWIEPNNIPNWLIEAKSFFVKKRNIERINNL